MKGKIFLLAAFFLVISAHIKSQIPGNRKQSDEIQLIRGPYLQSGTQTSMVIKWRTSQPTQSRVIYGTRPGELSESKINESLVTDHEILIDDLVKHTKYYYVVGNYETMFIESDPTYYFITSPAEEYNKVVRIWAIGDFGIGHPLQERVKNGYMKHRGDHHTDVWLMLGDIAYYHGKDPEFQRGIFDGHYTDMMRNTVIWPTPGNHDMRSADSELRLGPYYEVFTVPENGEAGGEPSGTEAYYSFNYGDIHFISLDSEDTPLDTDGEMAGWLKRDLENDKHNWKIVSFHHPAYSKGTHNSDNDMDSGGRMIKMRENFLPVLEDHGVDLVLGGHSHTYERSYLLRGHYGNSKEFDRNQMIIRNENVKKKDKSTFVKKNDNHGTVYVVCGVSGGHILDGRCNHPAMAVCHTEYHGSLAIEVRGNQLSAALVDEYGKVRDSFTITKEFSIPSF